MPITTPSLSCNHDHPTRRALIGSLGATAIAAPALLHAQQPTPMLTRRGTPQLTLGPMYPLTRPVEEDPDLTRLFGQPRAALGQVIEISGRILTEAGEPVPHGLIDLWQTNAAGRYSHPADTSGQPHDPGFQYAALLRADDQGRYHFRSVLPAPYEIRQRHIHFDVRGRNRRLMTQLFFPGEPNDRDNLYAGLRDAALQEAVTAKRIGERDGAWLFNWDIKLAGE
ncbi:MAG: hypothetical protein SFV20_04005 [Sphingopyxis sp.]|nr:hypothetical protein [Sphingopyxis sp.]